MKIAVALLLLSFPLLAHPEAVSYCDDPAVEQEWSSLMRQHGHLPEWRHLYDLRKYLCQQVKAGTLTLEEAIDQFEKARGEKVEQLRRRLETPGDSINRSTG